MDFDKAYANLGILDAFSYKDTVIHRLAPRAKVIATFAFIVTVVSFPKYEIRGLIPFSLFPVLLFSLGDIPVWVILKKVLVVSVFAVFIGLFNPLFDSRTVCTVYGIPISGGWISFISILLKFFLTLCSVLLLISTTSFPGICRALGQLGIPEVFISQLLFLYRYLFVLMEEALRMVRARSMRSFGNRGLGMHVFVSLIGTLFIRTIERAERIYSAMLSRGFRGTVRFIKKDPIGKTDFAFLVLTLAAFIVFRACDLVGLLGRQMERIF